mgnify:CR=1 FL=1
MNNNLLCEPIPIRIGKREGNVIKWNGMQQVYYTIG